MKLFSLSTNGFYGCFDYLTLKLPAIELNAVVPAIVVAPVPTVSAFALVYRGRGLNGPLLFKTNLSFLFFGENTSSLCF